LKINTLSLWWSIDNFPYLTVLVKLKFVQMETLGDIIRVEREKRGLLLRQVGAALEVDQALISKYERGERIPTKEQVSRLAKFYKRDENDLIAAWLADKILIELQHEKMALRAMKMVEEKIKSKK